MNGYRTIVSVMHRVVAYIRFRNSSDHMEMDGVTTQLERLSAVEEFSVLNAAHRGFIPGRVNHNVCSILVLRRSFRVSLEFQISRQKTHFSPHFNAFSARGIHSSIMLVNQRQVKSHQRFSACVCDRSDGPLFSVSSTKVRRCNSNLFTNLPVYRLHEGDLSSSRLGSDIHLSPSFRTGLSVQLDRAKSDSNDLVSVNGQVGVINLRMHRNRQFRSVGELFSSSLEIAISYHHIPRVKCSLMVLICGVWLKNERSFNHDKG